jgi:prolyl-tRNA synthetase
VTALTADQQRMYDDALAFREANTVDVKTLGDAIEAAQTGWGRVPWSAVGDGRRARPSAKAITVLVPVRPGRLDATPTQSRT